MWLFKNIWKKLFSNSKIKLEWWFNSWLFNFKVAYEKNFSEIKKEIWENDEDIIKIEESIKKWEKVDEKLLTSITTKYINKSNETRKELLKILNKKEKLNQDEWKKILNTIHNKIAKNQYLNTWFSWKLFKDEKIVDELNEYKKRIFNEKDLSDNILNWFINLVWFLWASQFLFIYDNKKYSIVSFKMLLNYFSEENIEEIKDLESELSKIEKNKWKNPVKCYKESLLIMKKVKEIYGVDNYWDLNFYIWVRYQSLINS